MTETTQLGLPIYGDNDVPDWMNTNDGFEALDSLVNSCSVVQLDWGNPIHSFVAGGGTWTATEDCWLCGVSRNSQGSLYVNGDALVTSGNGELAILSPTRIRKGDVVTCGVAMAISAYRGTLVSGNTYIFNEAQVTLDYSNPLHAFTANDSYTATEDCWLVGTGASLAITIDGKRICNSNSNQYVNLPPFKIAKGQTINTSSQPVGIALWALRGTVTGSISALHSDIPDYSNLIASLAYDANTYTATEECIVEFYFLSATLDNMAKVAVNDHVIGVTYNDTVTHMHFYKSIHLQKGDVLTWYGANPNLFVCNVFGLL